MRGEASRTPSCRALSDRISDGRDGGHAGMQKMNEPFEVDRRFGPQAQDDLMIL